MKKTPRANSTDEKREIVKEMLPSGFNQDDDYINAMSFTVRYGPWLLGIVILTSAAIFTLNYFL